MCGIVGFLDKRGGADRPVGRTLLAMLDALGCRGPDSTGVAIFGQGRGIIAQVKLPDHSGPAGASTAVLDAVRGVGSVVGHEITAAYLRLELDGSADVAGLEGAILA